VVGAKKESAGGHFRHAGLNMKFLMFKLRLALSQITVCPEPVPTTFTHMIIVVPPNAAKTILFPHLKYSVQSLVCL